MICTLRRIAQFLACGALAFVAVAVMADSAAAQVYPGNAGMNGGFIQGIPPGVQDLMLLRAMTGGRRHGIQTGVANPIISGDPMMGMDFGGGQYGGGQAGMGYGQGGMGNGMAGQGGMVGQGGMGGQAGMGQGGFANGQGGMGQGWDANQLDPDQQAKLERRKAARNAREQQQRAAREKALEAKRAKLATPAKVVAKPKADAS